MSDAGSGESRRSELKPAELEPGGIRKLRLGVAIYCAVELWALAASWVCFALPVRSITFLFGPTAAFSAMMCVIGMQIELWLAILSGEPIMNEKGEIDSNAPTERGPTYGVPPLVATLGILGIPARTVIIPAVACGISLLIFAHLMRRIRRISGQRAGSPGADG